MFAPTLSPGRGITSILVVTSRGSLRRLVTERIWQPVPNAVRLDAQSSARSSIGTVAACRGGRPVVETPRFARVLTLMWASAHGAIRMRRLAARRPVLVRELVLGAEDSYAASTCRALSHQVVQQRARMQSKKYPRRAPQVLANRGTTRSILQPVSGWTLPGWYNTEHGGAGSPC